MPKHNVKAAVTPTDHRIGRLAAWLGSEWFFRAIVIVMVLQAAWIAFTGRYPMAFDEDFHVGIIRIYAQHLNPFLQSQPTGADAFGAVARDPSYLYHYLMSFPYRLIAYFTDGQTIQVLWLRCINIALFTAGLPLYRRLLRQTGASRQISHLCLGVFILIPIVPLLAAQVNYDNLLLPLVALCLSLTLSWSQRLYKDQPLPLMLTMATLALCFMTGVVKYAFLPIFIGIVIFAVVRLLQVYKTKLWRAVVTGFTAARKVPLLVACLALLIGVGLFMQRDGINVIRYHTPVPDCAQVLTHEQCSAYGPWIRDYDYSINKLGSGNAKLYDLGHFTLDWFYGMWLRLFFTVDGPGTLYQTRGPFIVPSVGAIIFFILGIGLCIRYQKRIRERYQIGPILLFLLVTCTYVLVLFLDEFKSFVKTGQPVAINGRYLLPMLPLLMVVLGMGYASLYAQYKRLTQLLVVVMFACFLLGGGVLTYILRSNDAWYWPAQPVYDANHAVQNVVGPIIPGESKPTAFLH